MAMVFMSVAIGVIKMMVTLAFNIQDKYDILCRTGYAGDVSHDQCRTLDHIVPGVSENQGGGQFLSAADPIYIDACAYKIQFPKR